MLLLKIYRNTYIQNKIKVIKRYVIHTQGYMKQASQYKTFL